MKKHLALLLTTSALLFGCNNDENEITIPDEADTQLIIFNAGSITEEADIMLLGKDGSYILCNRENKDGYGVIYMNESFDNDISDGITTIVNQEGIPVITYSNEYSIIYDNVTDESFDCAIIDSDGEASYYWDIKTDYTTARGIEDLNPISRIMSTWQTIKNFDWTWDEHQKKALLPALAKISSFAITALTFKATPLKGASLIYTYISESMKSDGKDINDLIQNAAFVNDVIDIENIWKGGNLFKSIDGLGLLAHTLNDWADKEFEKMGHYEEIVKPIFEGKEWQIKLSTYLIECGTEETEYRVDVSTKALWEINDTNIDKDWCSVRKDGNQIIVKVKAYDGIDTRICSAEIKTAMYSSEIPSAKLTIRQDGVVFDVSESNLTFTQNGGSKGVYVYTNDNITSWEITAPDWCKITKGENSFFVDVEKSETDREGIIEVAGIVKNSGSYITKQIAVKQTTNNWNGTSWNFNGNIKSTGNMSYAGNINMANVTNFGIQITDVANNKFSLSGDLQGMESCSTISLDEQGQLIWNCSQDISESGVSGKMTVKIIFNKTEQTKAIGTLTGKMAIRISIPGEPNVNIDVDFDGTFNGTLLDDSK